MRRPIPENSYALSINANNTRSIRTRMDVDLKKLAEAYQANADHAAATNEVWSAVDTETIQYLGEPPGDD